ncbi:hypothetical protein HYC85_027714 [Camellia sinensis]|uniref:Uncharacterized protein n=1 Tax=Camellia sinensis TaxID=4442 RepID=A0A7J7FT23_CAMSI|nr:hypothetical protein HYC85_027714 [Camellia sinensis]
MTGKYATPATNELGIQIRTLCPVKDVKSWLDLDETTKSAVIQAVLVTDITCPQDGLPRDEIYAHPPLGVSLDDWKHLIDVAWQDASHQKRSKARKSNRSQLPYNHTDGSRSFPIAMDAMQKKKSYVSISRVSFYSLGIPRSTSVIARGQNGKAGHAIAVTLRGSASIATCENCQEMVNVQAAAIESGTPLTHEELSRQALREKRQKDHDELMKEREERERCYNELLKEREESIQLANEMLKEREEGQKAREETNTKVEHLNNVMFLDIQMWICFF